MNHEKIIAAFGGTSEVARLCECTPQAVSQWFGVDPKTGETRIIPKSRFMFLKVIRPDLFNELATPAKEAANG